MDERRDGKLVLAKLTAPSLPYDHVDRRRLHSLMQKALLNRVIVVAALPGSGKTTFMRELQLALGGCGEMRFSTAWLSVDAEDRQPTRFWNHFIKVLEQVYHIELPGLAHLDGPPAADQLTQLSNWIFEATEPNERQVVFIDDIDLLDMDEQVEMLQFVFNYLTDSSCVVVSSDKVPPLFSDFRFASRTYVIDPKTLAFTEEETGRLLESLSGRQLPADSIARVRKLSDGIPICIRLLADYHEREGAGYAEQSLEGLSRDQRVDGFFNSFLNQNGLTGLYDALLDLSLCDSVCAGLCTVMVGPGRGADIIQTLTALGLLSPATGRGTGWCRLQPLFRHWLRTRLSQKGECEVLDLVHRVAAWFKGRGYDAESAKLTIIGSDSTFLENLVATAGFERPYREDGFLSWACGIDAEDMPAMLYPSLYATWAYYLADDARNVRRWLENFRRAVMREFGDGIDSSSRRMAAQMADFIEIKCRQFEGCYDSTINELSRYLETRTNLQPAVLCLVYQAFGEAHERVGEFDKAYADYLHADALAETASLGFYKLFSRYTLAWLHIMRSADLDLAYETAQQALDECPEEYSIHGALIGLKAYTQIERFELDDAEENLELAIEALPLSRNTDMWLEEQVIKARLLSARGNYDEAYRTIVAATVPFEETGVSRGELCFAFIERARIDITRGDLEDAKSTVARLVSVSERSDVFYSLKIALIRTEVVALENGTDDVLVTIDDIIDEASRRSFAYLLIDAHITKSMVCGHLGERSKCFTALYEALHLASPIGAINPFARRGATMVPLLHDIASLRRIGKAERIFARRILSVAFDMDDDGAVGEEELPGARLTSREHEILALLNAGLARQEIAERLGVSPNTVKTHLGNIYSKLGVSNRSEAFSASRTCNR